MMTLNYFGAESIKEPVGVAVVLDFEEAKKVARAIRDANLGPVTHDEKSTLIGLRKVLEDMVYERPNP